SLVARALGCGGAAPLGDGDGAGFSTWLLRSGARKGPAGGLAVYDGRGAVYDGVYDGPDGALSAAFLVGDGPCEGSLEWVRTEIKRPLEPPRSMRAIAAGAVGTA